MSIIAYCDKPSYSRLLLDKFKEGNIDFSKIKPIEVPDIVYKNIELKNITTLNNDKIFR